MEQNNTFVLNDEKKEIQVQHAEPAIESMIMDIRGQQVILDHDLASLYDVETKALNQAVKRNIERFPSNFRFQLSEDEMVKLVTNCDRLEKLKHSSSLPFAFTEQGVAMLSAVLHSQTAIRVSIQIMDAFVAMRRFLASHTSLFQRVETLEHNQLLLFDHQSENDRRLGEVFQRLDNSQLTPKEGVFFDGQIFDAYAFASEMYLCRMNKQASIIMAVVTLFAVMAHAQTVYQKDRWGAKLYYMQENAIRQKDRWGEQLLWYDASTQQVRQKDRWGQPLIYIDGQTVRQKDRWGDPLLYFDGQTIRQKDRWGTPLYYLDGQTLRQKDRWGDAVYYFDYEPTIWQIACIILL